MGSVSVALERAEGGPGEGYAASLAIVYEGRRYRVTLRRLVRRPASIKYRMEGEHLVVELLDSRGAVVATCCIHRDHLERGCMDCPSLLVPPRRREDG